jgi:hypothetical protein
MGERSEDAAFERCAGKGHLGGRVAGPEGFFPKHDLLFAAKHSRWASRSASGRLLLFSQQLHLRPSLPSHLMLSSSMSIHDVSYRECAWASSAAVDCSTECPRRRAGAFSAEPIVVKVGALPRPPSPRWHNSRLRGHDGSFAGGRGPS